MDALSLFIILISVILAVLFKFVLVKKIRAWAERDLLKSLANGNNDRLTALTELNQDLERQGISRAERYHTLERKASELQAVDSD